MLNSPNHLEIEFVKEVSYQKLRTEQEGILTAVKAIEGAIPLVSKFLDVDLEEYVLPLGRTVEFVIDVVLVVIPDTKS